MIKPKVLFFIVPAISAITIAYLLLGGRSAGKVITTLETDNPDSQIYEGGAQAQDLNPLTIESLRNGQYPGSDIVVEQTLDSASNYNRYIASYKSEDLKIYAILTVPKAQKPQEGWPVVVFNHGYIAPAQYKTTEKYVAYVDAFARNGFIVFKPDFRGHGNSKGEASGTYGSSAYTIDVLNAVASIKKFGEASPNRIGMWGHSMGGHITLKSMVVSKDIKAGVIWAGVIGSYPDLLNNWRRTSFSPPPLPSGARRWRQALIEKYGDTQQNPAFWNSISKNSYLADISGPLQLHHGTADKSVPVEFSKKLKEQMDTVGKEVELYLYPEDDHNLSQNFSTAIQRSVEFFKNNL